MSIRIGIIGLDTSHAGAFTQVLNDPKAADDVAGVRVVAAYPQGSRDIADSVKRIPEYTEQLKKMGVEIVPSIAELVAKVDCVLLESNDGRVHLEQALPVLEAKKRLFIDKPIAGSLADVLAIYAAAKKHGTPVFTSSSLRYVSGAQKLRKGDFGPVSGCDAYSPAPLEATHPDLFWYGIHGVETLFTVMGTGCESVQRTHAKDVDVVVGRWSGERVGTFRGLRTPGATYGGTAFTSKGVQQVGTFEGYRPLVVEIVKFFKSGQLPVATEETIELYAFMEAADESKRRGGAEVKLSEVLEKAQKAAAASAAGR